MNNGKVNGEIGKEGRNCLPLNEEKEDYSTKTHREAERDKCAGRREGGQNPGKKLEFIQKSQKKKEAQSWQKKENKNKVANKKCIF